MQHNSLLLPAPYVVFIIIITEMSQHNNLPFCHGMRVRPPGRSSSVRNNPTGSLETGTPAEEKPRATKSFMAYDVSLIDLRGLLANETVNPQAST